MPVQLQQQSERSREEIESILESAKLNRNDLLPVTQEILFDCNFMGTEYKLIELGPDLMESIKIGSKLVFRGDFNESAVLCTDSSTFEIKEAETSNSLLIMKNLVFPEGATSSTHNSSPLAKLKNDEFASDSDQSMEIDEDCCVEYNKILSTAHSYLELKKVRPSLARIRTILEPSSYKGPEYESKGGSSKQVSKNEPPLITYEMLLERVPASEKEIQDYLNTIRAIDIAGFTRLIDEDYMFRVLTQVLNCMEENSWGNNDVVKSTVLDSLRSMHRVNILEKLFDWFFESVPQESDKNESNNLGMYALKEYEICRFFGEVLLKPVGRFNMTDFLNAWQESVPEGLKTNLRQLDGLAVSDTESSPPVVWYFPEYSLPETVGERFGMIFDTKKKWKHDEIIPYVQNIASSAQNVGSLLTKYSRVINVKGVKFYSAKYSK